MVIILLAMADLVPPVAPAGVTMAGNAPEDF